MRTTPFLLLAFALFLGGAAPAAAQWKNMKIDGLTGSDIDMMNAASDQLTDQEIGSETQWENAETHNSGRVKLMERDRQGDLPCRTMAHQLTMAKTTEVVTMSFRSCLKDGKWLLAPKE